LRRRGIQVALAVLLVAVTAAGLASAGCGGNGGGPVGNETVTIKYAAALPMIPGYFGSPTSESSTYYWEDAVETVTEGRVDIEIYTSELLCKQEMAFDAVSQGIADIAWAVITYCRDWMPLETVFYLGLDMECCEMNYQVHNHVYKEHLYPEYEKLGLTVVTLLGREKLIVFTARKPVRTIEDFEGLTMMSGGREMENLFSKLGLLSVSIQYQDVYEALEKGMLNAATLDITAPLLFHWYEAGDPGYIIDCGGIGNAAALYIAREDIVNKLRPEDAYALLKLTDYWFGVSGSQGSDRGNVLYWEEVDKVGMELIEWTESEKERLREMKRDTYEWWVGWMEDEYRLGAQAQALLDAVMEEMESFEPGNKAPGNPASYPDESLQQTLSDLGWGVDEASWQEVVGPDGHWGMDFVYEEDFDPWYEEWWDEQNMEHPWYENWKQQHP